MSRLRYNRREAVTYLRQNCRGMDGLIGRGGPFKLRVARDNDLFRALSSAIIYQQLSGKAAATIHGRFCALFDRDIPTAAGMSAVSMDNLRGAGLSRNKALAVIDLAEKVEAGALPSPRRMACLDDDAVVERLCRVRGVGPWTAQMYLIFNLGRPDVMPATDLGIQKGVQFIYDMSDLPTPAEVLDRTRHLSPYRSVASWYLWLAADTDLMTSA